MSEFEFGIPPEELPITSDAPQSQTEMEVPQSGGPSSGSTATDAPSPQTEPVMKVQPRRRVAASEFLNQSGTAVDTAKASELPEAPKRKKLELPAIPNMDILAIDDELGVQTEFDKARDKFLDLIESLQTGRYLTGTIQGVEKHSGGEGEPRAVLFHGDYKVVIMASMLVTLPQDIRDKEPNDVYYYLLTKRLGAEIDYVVKGIDPNTGLAVASRKEAMLNKRRYYYLSPTREGMLRMYEGLVCEARVVSVILDGIFVEIFGVDVYIPIYELSHVRLSDAMGYFEPGDRILVKITKLKRDDLNRIRVAASVKQVASNPVDRVIEKLEVGSCYAGTVSMADETGIFVNLDMGAECRCPFPYRSRPPKDARAIVKIGGIDMKRKIVWGTITYVTIPK